MDVAADDLTKPLGVEARSSRSALVRLPVGSILSAILAILAGGLAAYIALVDDPLGGEPHVVVSIEQLAASVTPSGPRLVVADPDTPRRSASEVETASGVAILRPNGVAAPASVIIRVPEPGIVTLAPAPDPRLVERTRHGPLPRIGTDGARPLQIYARPAGALPGGAPSAARIAVVITGLGISPSATAGAVAKLPPAVTLAFAPYGADLERHVADARGDGHEVMLQVPMEPFDYPDNDPGPHTLTTPAKPQENLDKLHWTMGRFSGYVGLVNFMGAKLTSNEAALAPILKEAAMRGLLVLDDGSSSRSVIGAVAPSVRAAAARADIVLDGTPQAEAIDKELARLEEMARKQGVAIGTASALPLAVDRIARWAQTLEARGILLVPISSTAEAR